MMMTMTTIITIDNNSQSGLHSSRCDKCKNSLNAISELQRETQFFFCFLMLLLLLPSSSFAVCATNQSPLHISSQESGVALAMNKITLGITREGKRKSNYQTVI